MDRVLMRDLAAWKNSPQRKPLLLDGPRRVGKTSLVKEFGRRYFRHTAYVDLARSEEHTSELQSLRLISYAVFCLKKKTAN